MLHHKLEANNFLCTSQYDTWWGGGCAELGDFDTGNIMWGSACLSEIHYSPPVLCQTL